MRIPYCIFLALLITTVYNRPPSIKVPIRDNVYLITKNNFFKVIESYEYVLIKFYSPSCKFCKKMAPEFIKAAEVYSEDDPFIAFGEIDASKD